MESESKGRSWDWAPPPEVARTGGPQARSTGADLEAALTAAERLLAEATANQRRAETMRTSAVALGLAGGSALAALFAIASSRGFTTGEVAALIALGALAVAATWLVLRVAIVARSRVEPRRMRIAVDLAALVADVYLEVARREGWSYVRTEATKLRLSTFPLAHRGAMAISEIPGVPDRATS